MLARLKLSELGASNGWAASFSSALQLAGRSTGKPEADTNAKGLLLQAPSQGCAGVIRPLDTDSFRRPSAEGVRVPCQPCDGYASTQAMLRWLPVGRGAHYPQWGRPGMAARTTTSTGRGRIRPSENVCRCTPPKRSGSSGVMLGDDHRALPPRIRR
jgi:hypothetical protein